MDIKGLKLNFLGDSITFGYGIENNLDSKYDNRLKATCGFASHNVYAVNGSRMAHQTKPSEKPYYDLCFCGRAYTMDTSADMVVVYGGVNDFIHGDAPFGEVGDTTPTTYCGGVYFLMNYLKETYKDKPIVFMTPAHMFLRHEVSDRIPSTHAAKRVEGRPLVEYVDAMLEIAKIFGIPTLDLYRNLGIDPHNEDEFVKYTLDGLHFNENGHAVIAQKLKEFIEAI